MTPGCHPPISLFPHEKLTDACWLLHFQFFEYTSQNEIRYNTHQPEACIAVDAGMDMLIMDLCKEIAPENQKFMLQEVSKLSHSFLAVGLWAAEEALKVEIEHAVWHRLGKSQGCSHEEQHRDPWWWQDCWIPATCTIAPSSPPQPPPFCLPLVFPSPPRAAVACSGKRSHPKHI